MLSSSGFLSKLMNIPLSWGKKLYVSILLVKVRARARRKLQQRPDKLLKEGRIVKTFPKFMRSARNFHLPIISTSFIILTILIVYWQDLSILFNEALQSEAVSHIVLIPFLVSYLIYRKKELVKASLALEQLRGKTKLISVSDIVGAAFCLTAFLLYWYGSYTFYPLEYHITSLLIFIMGVTLILSNVKTLIILIFPILFLAFLILPPSSVTYTAGALLANINTQGSYTLLKTAGLPVTLSHKYGAPIIALNTSVSTSPIEFAVYQASSGIYSLIAFIMFATFLVYITRGSLTRRAALFGLGLLILPILNIIRISLIVSIAHWLGEEIAMTIFHTFTGWLLIFSGILLLLLIGEKFLHLQILGGSKQAGFCSECNDRLKNQESFCLNCGKFLKPSHVRISKRFWMKVIALLISSYLVVVSIQAPVFAFAPELTLSNSSPQVNTNVFPEIRDYQLQFLYRDVSFERAVGQDASLIYAYLPQNASTLPVYVIVGVANSISSLHNWEVSLIAWRVSQGLPPLVTLLESGDMQLTENPRIIARYIVFQHPSNYTYTALYWYQKAMFKTGLTVEPRYVRINLLILTTNPNDSAKLIEELQTMGQSIAVYWEPLRVQSLVSLGIPLQQFLLGSTVVAAIFVQTSQYALEQRKKKTNLKIFEKLAPPKEKLLNQTIKELSQKTKETTTQNIASAFEKATGKAAKQNELIHMLNNLEKHGIISADIINIIDQPRLVWKP